MYYIDTNVWFILAQVCAVISGGLGIFAVLANKSISFLNVKITKLCLNIMNNIFLGEAVVIPIMLIECVRNMLYKKSSSKKLVLVFLILIWSLCIMLYTPPKLIFLLVGYTVSTVGYCIKNMQRLRIVEIVNLITWIPWDYSIGNYTKIVMNMVFVGILLYKYIHEKRGDTHTKVK